MSAVDYTDEQLQAMIDRGLKRVEADLAAAVERRDAKLDFLRMLDIIRWQENK